MAETVDILAALCVLAGLKYSVLVTGFRKRPRKAEKVGQVTGLWYYPVKSCLGIKLDHASCTREGIIPEGSSILDRHLCVYDPETKNFLTQRQEPTLSQVKPSLTPAGQLQLDAPGQDTLLVDLPSEGSVIPCRIWQDTQECLDCGPKAEQWLTKYLGSRRGLAYAADHLTKRAQSNLTSNACRPYTAPHEKVAFADYSSYHIANEASLQDLNKKLSEPVSMANFRPNIAVSNKNPFDEDNWEEIYINNVRFRRVKPSERCIMTTINPTTSDRRKNQEPMTTLRTYRIQPDHSKTKPVFGANIFADLEGTINAGDDVYVIYKED